MRKLEMFYYFCDSEEQAKKACERINRNSNPYRRKNRAAHYTFWKNRDGSGLQKFVVFYYM